MPFDLIDEMGVPRGDEKRLVLPTKGTQLGSPTSGPRAT
jgi:hypothetical protein